MKKIFMLVVKLAGLYVIVGGVLNVAALAAVGAPSMPGGETRALQLFQWLKFLIPLFTISVGVGLIVFSGVLANLVGATGTIETAEFSAAAFLRIGCILIGLHYILGVAGESTAKIMDFASSYASESIRFSSGDLVGLALAFLLVFRAGVIAKYAEKVNRAS